MIVLEVQLHVGFSRSAECSC